LAAVDHIDCLSELMPRAAFYQAFSRV